MVAAAARFAKVVDVVSLSRSPWMPRAFAGQTSLPQPTQSPLEPPPTAFLLTEPSGRREGRR
jgi:hypothetical protein